MDNHNLDRIADVLEAFLKMAQQSPYLFIISSCLIFFLVGTPIAIRRVAVAIEQNNKNQQPPLKR